MKCHSQLFLCRRDTRTHTLPVPLMRPMTGGPRSQTPHEGNYWLLSALHLKHNGEKHWSAAVEHYPPQWSHVWKSCSIPRQPHEKVTFPRCEAHSMLFLHNLCPSLKRGQRHSPGLTWHREMNLPAGGRRQKGHAYKQVVILNHSCTEVECKLVAYVHIYICSKSYKNTLL